MKEINYSQSGDYLLPDLALPETEHAAIGKYFQSTIDTYPYVM